MNKVLLLLLAHILFNCSGGTEEVPHDEQSQNPEETEPKQEGEEAQGIVIPESSTIETSFDVAEKAVPPVWEKNVDLLDGEVKDITMFNDQIYVFGDQFGIKGYEEAYEQYVVGNGESIHYYLHNPVYTRSSDVFIRSYSQNGNENNTEVIDFEVVDWFQRFAIHENEILFSVGSNEGMQGGESFIRIGKLYDHEMQFYDYLNENTIGFHFLDDVIIESLLDPKTYETSAQILNYPDNNSDPHIVAENVPYIPNNYKIDNEIWGISLFYTKIESCIIGEKSKQTIEVSFANPVFKRIQLGTLKAVSNRVYQFGYLSEEDDYTGFYWTAYDHGTNPVFHYFMSDDSILFTNLFMVDDGFFITGQEDGKMLLVFLNSDGEIQWKAHFREGTLRGIAEQDGRYFIAGDYHTRATDKENDYGVDYLYLAEIGIE